MIIRFFNSIDDAFGTEIWDENYGVCSRAAD